MTNPYPPQYGQQPHQAFGQQYQPATFNPAAPSYPQQDYAQAPLPQQFQAQPQQFQPYGAPAQQFGQFQGYPQQPQPPRPAPVQGTLSDYMSQPVAGEGKAWGWANKPLGATLVGMVARELTDSDTQQQTNQKTGELQFFRNGQPKLVLKIPMFVQPDAEHTEGKGVWWCNRRILDTLMAAMKAAGYDGQLPEAGSVITRRLVDRRALFPNSGAANIEEIIYQRPQGAVGNVSVSAPAPAPTVQAPPVMQQVPVTPTVEAVIPMAQPVLPGMPVAAAPQQFVPEPVAPYVIPGTPGAAPMPVADPAAGLPALTPQMQALMQQLDQAKAQ